MGVRTHLHQLTHVCAHARTHTHIFYLTRHIHCRSSNTSLPVNTHTHTHAHTHTHMRTHTHTSMHANTHTCTRTHIFVRPCMYTCISLNKKKKNTRTHSLPGIVTWGVQAHPHDIDGAYDDLHNKVKECADQTWSTN